MTNLKNTWNPGDGFFASDANAVATQINQNTADVAAAVSAVAGKQPGDVDLTAIAALTPAEGDTIVRVAGAWVNRTMAQLKTALGLVKADVGLGSVDNTSDAAKNVLSATKLTTARNINGVAFDGTTNITVADSTKLATSAVTDNADGTISVGSVTGLGLLPLAAAVITANTAPAIGKTTYYNASAGALNVPVLALSGLTVGQRFAVRRDPADTSSNAITFTLAGGDTFYSSGATSFTLPISGEQREFKVESISGTKYYAPSGPINPVAGNDARYIAGVYIANNYGARGDAVITQGAITSGQHTLTMARTVADGAITTGQATLTSPTAGFTQGDIGSTIAVTGAGAAGGTLTTTIVSVVNDVATLAANASTTVTNASTTVTGKFVSADVGKTVVVPGAGAARTVADAAINIGTAAKALTSATAAFTSADARQTITIAGAGAAGATLTTKISSVVNATTITLEDAASTTVSGASLTISSYLMTTIASVNTGVATLAGTAAGRTVSGQSFIYGTDDTAAANAALTAAKAAGGGMVYFPRGKYLVGSSTSLDGADRIHVSGAGVGATEIYRTGVGGTGIFHTGGYYTSPGLSLTDFTMSDLTLDGFFVQSASYSVHNCGVRAQTNLTRCTFRHMYVRHTLATGMAIDGMQGGSLIFNVNTYKCGSGNRGGYLTPTNGGAAGIGIGHSLSLGDYTVMSCHADSNGTYGIFMETVLPNAGIRGAKIIGCSAANNYVSGFADNGIYGALFESCNSYSNKQDGFQSSGATIANNAPTDGGCPGQDTIYSNCFSFGNIRHGFSYEPWLLGQSTNAETDAATCRVSYKGCKSLNNSGRGWDVQTGSTGVVDSMRFDNCEAYQNGLSGLGFGGLGTIKNVSINGGSYYNNATANTSNDKYGIRFTTITITDLNIRNVRSYDNNATPHQSHGISFNSTCNVTGIVVENNDLRGNVTAAIDKSWASAAGTKIFRNNAGVPVAQVWGSAFALASSGNPWTNNTGTDVTLYVTAAGTVTAVVVNGVSVSGTMAVGNIYRVPAMGTFQCSYSVAPTLVAVGD